MRTFVTCRACGQSKQQKARGLCRRCYNQAWRANSLDSHPTLQHSKSAPSRKRRHADELIHDLMNILTDLQIDDVAFLVADLGYEGRELALAKLLYRHAQRIQAYANLKKAGRL